MELRLDQQAVMNSNSKRVVIAGSRRSGKTLTALHRVFQHANTRPGTSYLYLYPYRPVCTILRGLFTDIAKDNLKSVTLDHCRLHNESIVYFHDESIKVCHFDGIVVDNCLYLEDWGTLDKCVAALSHNQGWLQVQNAIDSESKLFEEFRSLFGRRSFESHNWSKVEGVSECRLLEIKSQIGEKAFNQQYLNIWPKTLD